MKHVCDGVYPERLVRFELWRRGPSTGARRSSDGLGWHHHRVVFIFLAWLAVGIVMWRGYHRVAMLGAVGSMILTLVMLKVHATDVIGLCL